MDTIIVIVETPKGSGQKFDYDPVLGAVKLNKVMPAGLVFPFDFGFIPGTVGGDGDPVDALLISELATFPGCAVECRVIGAVQADQRERNGDTMRNDRILAVPAVSVQYGGVQKLTDLPAGVLEQITHFFVNYNEQAGKEFKPLQQLGPRQAVSIIEKARANAEKTRLIQLLIPVKDDQDKPFPEKYFRALADELKQCFGGLTIYARSPAKGIWKDGRETVHDDLVIYEVMAAAVDQKYWAGLKSRLEKQFKQDEVMITASAIQHL